MKRKQHAKVFLLALALCCAVLKLQALPEYMRIYAADPYAKAELRRQCATCHLNEAGGGERNAFGKAFAAAGYKINETLRTQFPDRFSMPDTPQALPVSFVSGSDSQAIIEANGKRYLIDTKTRTVKEVSESGTAVTAARPTPASVAAPAPAAAADSNVYQQGDVRLVNLPTAKPLAKGAVITDFTHRFPFHEYDVTDGTRLWGLDGTAVPSFGFAYGITDRLHVGGYRSPSVSGRPILLYVGASLLDENKQHPFSAMARVGVEGQGNFQRNFTTTLEVALARSITNKAQLYFVPAVSFKNRPFPTNDPEPNVGGATTFAMGLGGALNIRPTIALLAEANWRVNEKGRFGNTAPVYGFGIEKVTVSRRHSFSLIFSNAAGTTMAQRSATVRSFFIDDSFRQSLAIGFNISRRIF